MRKKQKTTVSIYFSASLPSFGFYSVIWLTGLCSASFTGTDAKEWEEKWNSFKLTKLKEAEVEFEKQRNEKIKKLELELSVTFDSLFRKVRKQIEDKLQQEKDSKFCLNEWAQLDWIYKFLPDDCVKISTEGGTTIYEILSPRPAPIT